MGLIAYKTGEPENILAAGGVSWVALNHTAVQKSVIIPVMYDEPATKQSAIGIVINISLATAVADSIKDVTLGVYPSADGETVEDNVIFIETITASGATTAGSPYVVTYAWLADTTGPAFQIGLIESADNLNTTLTPTVVVRRFYKYDIQG